MIYITETESAALITRQLAFDTAREALVAATTPKAASFPVVLGHASDPQNRFTIKSASDAEMTGVKVGSYFPTNDQIGTPRHNSLILLFDQSVGKIGAIVEGGQLNAYRTAAADAVAVDTLARKDAKVLTIFGTGHQAEFEILAVSEIRDLERILVVGRAPERTEAFVARLKAHGLNAEASEAEKACRQADVIITATTAQAPLFDASWVTPGTHVSSMGSDRTGKQELPPQLFDSAHLFCDLPEQSLRIGEFQHWTGAEEPVALGEVLSRQQAGRRDEKDITVFDSSGISLQDLYVAKAIIARYQDQRD